MQADIDPFLSIYSHLMLPLLHGFIYKYLQRFYGAFFLAISKAGVMIPPLCVNLQILRTLELPVCLFVPRLIDQFTKIYDPPFGSIYRELWWPICHNLQGFFNPLVVLQIEDTTGMYKHSKQILFKSSLYILLTEFFLLTRSHPIRQLNCIKCMWNEYTNIFVSKQVEAARL